MRTEFRLRDDLVDGEKEEKIIRKKGEILLQKLATIEK